MTAEQYLLRVHDLRMEVARLSTEYEARAAQARSAAPTNGAPMLV